MMLFSASRNGFFDDAIHSPDQIPDDAKPITDEEYALLMAGQVEGNAIVADANGLPTLQAPASPTTGELWESIRSTRDALLFSSDWTQGNDSPLSTGAIASWKTYRQALRDLPENTPNPATVNWPTPPAQ